ncbi:hypothetical protein DL93DRAFT_2072140 [Clavulina sp. PMI_390]|nr:hypothetical protein DL93DRAFT_2072140 [Clavulina sp. PMI_390]
MDELSTLVGLLEGKPDQDDVKFTGLQLQGLSQIEHEHGRNSEVYHNAAKALQGVFSHAGLKTRKVAILVHPSDQQQLYSRADTKLKHGVIPIFSSSQCFTSADSCTNSTSSCSGHGSCIQVSRADKTCWSCACGSTTDSKGRKTSWAGSSCQKQDYSVQFVLLAGSTILLIAVAIGSVSILYTVGAAELPNVLTSGSSGHLKRD